MNLRTELADFLGPEIVSRDITYRGKTRTFYFRVLGGDDAEKTFAPGKEKTGFRSRVIAAVLCHEDGLDAFTRDEAGSLPNAFQNELIGVAFELNGIGQKAKEEAGNEPSA